MKCIKKWLERRDILAKLKTVKHCFKSEIGDKLEFESDVSVLSSGVFNVSISEELVPIVDELIKLDEYGGLYLQYSRNRKPIICGDRLDKCEKLVIAAGNDYVQCDISTEEVILYSVKNSITYVKSPKGEIFPNGSFVEAEYGNGGKWYGDLDATNRKPIYGVGFVARCYEKITYSRPSGVKTEYRKSYTEGEYRKLLNSFCGISLKTDEMNEIPYSEEAAQFFYRTMLSMCYLADKLDVFFNDKIAVTKAIKNKTALLLSEVK